MLTHLTVQNFGLIDKVELDLSDGLNILTGETGAGKSILIDALRFALGDRQSSSILRDSSKPGLVEIVLEIRDKDLKKLEILQDLWGDEENTLIIHRSLQPDGKNKIKINGFNITLHQLKEIGNYLIDFHGAHDHQMLLSSTSHQGLLDRLVDFGKLLEEYTPIYQNYLAAVRKKEQILSLAQGRERELDLLTHQVKELGQVPLEQEFYDELTQKQAKVNNAERLYQYISELQGIFDAEESGLSENIRKAFSPLRNLNQIDEKTQKWLDSLSQIQQSAEQFVEELNDYASSLSFEPQEAAEINRQADIFDDILRKYGPTLDAAKEFYIQAKEKLNLLQNWDENVSDIDGEIAKLEKKLRTLAQQITKERQKAAGSLKKTIEKELSELGMPQVKFDVHLNPSALHATGADEVIFYISPNAGESLKPLSEIVSSGEAARVMLALKKALIKVDPIPVLIFDEIDAQIGGRLGSITGQKLREIAQKRQVILITHLPQIASFADAHFKVLKTVKDGRTQTSVAPLNKEARVKEIAQMMSGEKETDIAVKHAHDMLAKAKG